MIYILLICFPIYYIVSNKIYDYDVLVCVVVHWFDSILWLLYVISDNDTVKHDCWCNSRTCV